MEQVLEIKQFEKKEGKKYKTIQITDIALHADQRATTPSFGKKLKEVLRSGKPGRTYSQINKFGNSESHTFIIDLLKNDPEFLELIREEEAKGYTVLISLPNSGIPIVAAKDTIDFVNSVKGKRILRRLYKDSKPE